MRTDTKITLVSTTITFFFKNKTRLYVISLTLIKQNSLFLLPNTATLLIRWHKVQPIVEKTRKTLTTPFFACTQLFFPIYKIFDTQKKRILNKKLFNINWWLEDWWWQAESILRRLDNEKTIVNVERVSSGCIRTQVCH
jgi:hypothetical protein